MREATLVRTDLRGATLDELDLVEARLATTRLDVNGAVLLAEQSGARVDAS